MHHSPTTSQAPPGLGSSAGSTASCGSLSPLLPDGSGSSGGGRGASAVGSAGAAGRAATSACTDGSSAGSSGPGSGFEVRLVLEYCEGGSLKEALQSGGLRLQTQQEHPGACPAVGGGSGSRRSPSSATPAGSRAPDYLAVLETAADVARGMSHLHASNIVHADLKASGWGGGAAAWWSGRLT